MVVGSDGNLALAEIGGGKKLYTGALSSLINFNNEILTISKDFDMIIVTPNVEIFSISAKAGNYAIAGANYLIGIYAGSYFYGITASWNSPNNIKVGYGTNIGSTAGTFNQNTSSTMNTGTYTIFV